MFSGGIDSVESFTMSITYNGKIFNNMLQRGHFTDFTLLTLLQICWYKSLWKEKRIFYIMLNENNWSDLFRMYPIRNFTL